MFSSITTDQLRASRLASSALQGRGGTQAEQRGVGGGRGETAEVFVEQDSNDDLDARPHDDGDEREEEEKHLLVDAHRECQQRMHSASAVLSQGTPC